MFHQDQNSSLALVSPVARVCLLAMVAIALSHVAGPSAQAHALDVFAQATPRNNPFNVGISEGGSAPHGGLAGWIWAKQIQFERMLSGSVRAIKTDSTAFWTLLGISFSYGAFHAAGPGHGKAVVAAYMFANERALKRGIVISFMAALLQGVVAITIVAVLAWALNATSGTMKSVAHFVEIASFAGIALLGAWLVWRKGRAFAAALPGCMVAAHPAHDHGHSHGHPHANEHSQEHSHAPAPALAHAHSGVGHGNDHGHHAHAQHDHAHTMHAHHDHADPHHVHDEHCGHFHAPDPKTLGDNFSWKEAIATVFAAGSRPCSGAILVLVFALAQGIFLAGIAATFAMALGTALTTGALAAGAVLAKDLAIRFLGEGNARTLIMVRALELLAALMVLLLGIILFTGSLGR